jgi:hypothetical protein
MESAYVIARGWAESARRAETLMERRDEDPGAIGMRYRLKACGCRGLAQRRKSRRLTAYQAVAEPYQGSPWFSGQKTLGGGDAGVCRLQPLSKQVTRRQIEEEGRRETIRADSDYVRCAERAVVQLCQR